MKNMNFMKYFKVRNSYEHNFKFKSGALNPDQNPQRPALRAVRSLQTARYNR